MYSAEIKKLAKDIRKQLNGKVDFNSLAEYANQIGWPVVLDKDNTAKVLAFAHKDELSQFICISRSANKSYATHLLAHELGHILLKHTQIFAGDNNQMEDETEYFAKCLLKKPLITIKHKPATIAIGLLFICLMTYLVYYNNYMPRYYITTTGSRYHMANCQYVQDTPNKEISKHEAINGKYTPCEICIDN